MRQLRALLGRGNCLPLDGSVASDLSKGDFDLGHLGVEIGSAST
jgi:hypothetical protein